MAPTDISGFQTVASAKAKGRRMNRRPDGTQGTKPIP